MGVGLEDEVTIAESTRATSTGHLSLTLLALAIGGFAIGALGSIVAINLQIRLMHAAGDAQMLGAALDHSALNIANGLGAWIGSAAIAAGLVRQRRPLAYAVGLIASM